MSNLPRPPWVSEDVWAREYDKVRKLHHWLALTERAPYQFRTLVDRGTPDERPEVYDEHIACGPRVVAWQGRVRPFGSHLTDDEIWKLITDLDSPKRPSIGVCGNGSLGHLDDCTEDHAALRDDVRRALTPLPALGASYFIEVIYPKPPAYPFVRALEPRISISEFPDMPHPLKDRAGLCVSYPPDLGWTFERDGAARFADDAVLYLARHTLWLRLSGKVRQPWLGAWASHHPLDLIKARPTDPCQCGTGRPFGNCCRPRIALQAERARRHLTHVVAASEMAWVEAQLLATRVRGQRPLPTNPWQAI